MGRRPAPEVDKTSAVFSHNGNAWRLTLGPSYRRLHGSTDAVLVVDVMAALLMDLVGQPLLLEVPFNFNCDISHFRPRHRYQRNDCDSDGDKHKRDADDEQCH